MGKQLNYCQAYVDTIGNRQGTNYYAFQVVVHDTGEVVTIKHGSVLTSYQSKVAVWDDDNCIMYLLPRWNYSSTTRQHMHKWSKQYTSCHFSVIDAKYDMKIHDHEQYIACDGYLNCYDKMQEW